MVTFTDAFFLLVKTAANSTFSLLVDDNEPEAVLTSSLSFLPFTSADFSVSSPSALLISAALTVTPLSTVKLTCTFFAAGMYRILTTPGSTSINLLSLTTEPRLQPAAASRPRTRLSATNRRMIFPRVTEFARIPIRLSRNSGEFRYMTTESALGFAKDRLQHRDNLLDRLGWQEKVD